VREYWESFIFQVAGMIKEFKAIFTVLQQGKEVANPERLKRVQNYANLFATVAGAALTVACGFDVCLDLNSEQLTTIGSGVAIIYGAANAYFTTASSKRVGIGKG
jgi:hypothetical protein